MHQWSWHGILGPSGGLWSSGLVDKNWWACDVLPAHFPGWFTLPWNNINAALRHTDYLLTLGISLLITPRNSIKNILPQPKRLCEYLQTSVLLYAFLFCWYRGYHSPGGRSGSLGAACCRRRGLAAALELSDTLRLVELEPLSWSSWWKKEHFSFRKVLCATIYLQQRCKMNGNIDF